MPDKLHVTMLAAVSQDGFIADSEGQIDWWTSAEDKHFFNIQKKSAYLYIMGSGTYDAINPQPQADVLRIVMTRDPSRYSDRQVEGQLHFESLSPQEIVDKYHAYGKAVLLGGRIPYGEFLSANLVNDAYITTEHDQKLKQGTKLLDSGKPFESAVDVLSKQRLQTSRKSTSIAYYVLK